MGAYFLSVLQEVNLLIYFKWKGSSWMEVKSVFSYSNYKATEKELTLSVILESTWKL